MDPIERLTTSFGLLTIHDPPKSPSEQGATSRLLLENLEKIFSYLDEHNRATLSLVNRRWMLATVGQTRKEFASCLRRIVRISQFPHTICQDFLFGQLRPLMNRACDSFQKTRHAAYSFLKSLAALVRNENIIAAPCCALSFPTQASEFEKKITLAWNRQVRGPITNYHSLFLGLFTFTDPLKRDEIIKHCPPCARSTTLSSLQITQLSSGKMEEALSVPVCVDAHEYLHPEKIPKLVIHLINRLGIEKTIGFANNIQDLQRYTALEAVARFLLSDGQTKRAIDVASEIPDIFVQARTLKDIVRVLLINREPVKAIPAAEKIADSRKRSKELRVISEALGLVNVVRGPLNIPELLLQIPEAQSVLESMRKDRSAQIKALHELFCGNIARAIQTTTIIADEERYFFTLKKIFRYLCLAGRVDDCKKIIDELTYEFEKVELLKILIPQLIRMGKIEEALLIVQDSSVDSEDLQYRLEQAFACSLEFLPAKHLTKAIELSQSNALVQMGIPYLVLNLLAEGRGPEARKLIKEVHDLAACPIKVIHCLLLAEDVDTALEMAKKTSQKDDRTCALHEIFDFLLMTVNLKKALEFSSTLPMGKDRNFALKRLRL